MRDSKQQSAKHFITPLGVVIQLSVLGILGAKHCQTAINLHALPMLSWSRRCCVLDLLIIYRMVVLNTIYIVYKLILVLKLNEFH